MERYWRRNLDWAGFAAYFEQTVASERLAVGRSAREIAARVLFGAGHVPVPRWYGDLTAGLMPESLRHAFRLSYDEREQRRASEPFAS